MEKEKNSTSLNQIDETVLIENIKNYLMKKVIPNLVPKNLPKRLQNQFVNIFDGINFYSNYIVIEDSIKNKLFNTTFLIGPNTTGKSLTLK
jgi:hypothetical protein